MTRGTKINSLESSKDINVHFRAQEAESEKLLKKHALKPGPEKYRVFEHHQHVVTQPHITTHCNYNHQ